MFGTLVVGWPLKLMASSGSVQTAKPVACVCLKNVKLVRWPFALMGGGLPSAPCLCMRVMQSPWPQFAKCVQNRISFIGVVPGNAIVD